MKDYGEDWKDRTAYYLAKDKALRAAIAKSKIYNAYRSLACSFFAAVGLWYFWGGSWHALIGLAAMVLGLHIGFGVLIYYAWTAPELARIEALYPTEKS